MSPFAFTNVNILDKDLINMLSQQLSNSVNRPLSLFLLLHVSPISLVEMQELSTELPSPFFL